MLKHKFKKNDLSISHFLAFGAAKMERLHLFVRRGTRYTSHIPMPSSYSFFFVALVLSRFGVVDQHHHVELQIL